MPKLFSDFRLDYRPLVNLCLRVVTMACRFLLVFALAKLLNLSELGLFGLVSATIIFSQLVIGGEFYTYSQRELITQGISRRSFVLQHQGITLLCIYILIAPMLLGVFFFDLLPMQMIGWFYFLLISESIAQELNRVLIALQCQIMASVVLFVRHGLWVMVVLPLMWFEADLRSLSVIFFAWSISVVAAVLIGVFLVKEQTNDWKIWPLDLSWIKKGLRISFLYFLGALCFRSFFTLDRYVVENLMGIEFLGIYTVFIGLAMTIVTVLDPLIFSFLYPKLVAFVRDKDVLNFKAKMALLFWSTLLVALVGVAVVVFVSPFIFDWIDKPEFSGNLPVLWILLVAAFFYGVSMVPHFGLYALNDDRSLFKTHLISLGLFLTCLYLFPSFVPLKQVVGSSLITGFLAMALLKGWFYSQHKTELV